MTFFSQRGTIKGKGGRMSLEKELKEKQKLQRHSFHFPGHKGKWKTLYQDLASLDTTETFGTDNLAKPEGILKDAMEEISAIYKSHRTFFCMGGSTMGIYAGLYALSRPGDKVGVQRNAHRSVFQACELLNLKIEILDVEKNSDGLAKSLSVESLKKAENLDILVVTSPSYYGFLAPMKEIMDYAQDKKVKILVDEAHGGHLPFFKKEASALNFGADIVVHSVHKMLPGLTSTALVHSGPRVDEKKLQRGLNLFTTTSPSYLMMVSIDKAVHWMDENGREKLQELDAYLKLKEEELKEAGVRLVEDPDKDSFKVLMEVPGYGGKDLYDRLFYDYGLAMEMYDNRFVLAVVTAFDDKEDLDALVEGVKSLEKRPPLKRTWPRELVLEERNLTIDRRSGGEKSLYYKEALGYRALDFITPYPPGIPIIFPGQKIGPDHIKTIQAYLKEGIHLEGLDQKERMEVMD